MKKLILLIGFIGFSGMMSAQNRIEAGLTAIPSLTNFHTGSSSTNYEPIFTFNYGARINWRKNNWVFSTGILHLTQSTKQEWAETSSNNPQGTGEFFDVYMRTKTIAIPLNVDYVFASANKTEFFGGLGIYMGYIYAQNQENTSITEDYEPDPWVSYPREYFIDYNYFEDFYLGANIGAGINHSLNDHLSLQFRPNLLIQLREELPKETHAWTARLLSISVEAGICYSF